ncbi:MAG: molecular chaperone HtpG [Deinococcales bacterium]
MPDETIAFRTEITQLLDILVHSLYTEREIFLRELLSNASDALYRFKLESLTEDQVADPAAELGIWLRPDPEAHTLSVRDTGRGMSREELVQNLGTIAHSGARSFTEALRELNQNDTASARELIGRFGVGFYSVFMVAEQAEVRSRSLRPAEEPAHWRSTGGGSFDVGTSEGRERGTEVVLTLKEDAREYLEPQRLRQVVRAHSNYVPFPIYLWEDGAWTQVNDQTALWRERPGSVTEEQHRAFLGQLRFGAEEPLLTVHLQADVPLQFYALLYVPSRRDPMLLRDPDGDGLRLYARKVLIEEHNRSLLPRYLRFLVGVVDAEDLPLNVSRETVQSTPVLARIRSVLTKRVIGEIARLAEEDGERFEHFLREYGAFLKEAVATDPARDERIPDLLRFRTTRDESVSLQQYVGRMKDGQQDIYYVQADDAQAALASPHLEPFRNRDLEVLVLTEPLDAFLPMGLPSYQDHPLRDVGEAELELPAAPEAVSGEASAGDAELDDAVFGRVLDRVRTVLGDRVAEVRESRLLERSPARLVAPAGAPAGVERLRRLTEEDYRAAPRVLELNRRSELLRQLGRRLEADPDDALVPELVTQLFETQLLLEGLHPNPATMATRIERLLTAASQAPTGAPHGAPTAATEKAHHEAQTAETGAPETGGAPADVEEGASEER